MMIAVCALLLLKNIPLFKNNNMTNHTTNTIRLLLSVLVLTILFIPNNIDPLIFAYTGFFHHYDRGVASIVP